ncbi:hypothetical protein I5U65_02280 [Stenotrophomonas maltophilia]|nr:hypothetical protein [Stenotrophomonas maltophilia]
MPRLSKGQVAAGVRDKQLRAERSVRGIIAILDEAVAVGSFPEEHGDLFRRMSDLAGMNDEARGIFPMSVRTLRKNVESLYPGGMGEFRRAIGELLGAARAPVVQQEDEAWLEDAVLDMTARYSDLVQRFKRLALGSEAAADELKRHFDRYRGSSSLRVVK